MEFVEPTGGYELLNGMYEVEMALLSRIRARSLRVEVELTVRVVPPEERFTLPTRTDIVPLMQCRAVST